MPVVTDTNGIITDHLPQLVPSSCHACADISAVVPTANAISVLFNALADFALGERYRLTLLIPGLALVFLGVVLCGL